MSMTYTTNAELDARKARRERIAAQRAARTVETFTGTVADLQDGDFVEVMGGKVGNVTYRKYRVDARVTAVTHTQEWQGKRRGYAPVTTFKIDDMTRESLPMGGHSSYPVTYRREVA